MTTKEKKATLYWSWTKHQIQPPTIYHQMWHLLNLNQMNQARENCKSEDDCEYVESVHHSEFRFVTTKHQRRKQSNFRNELNDLLCCCTHQNIQNVNKYNTMDSPRSNIIIILIDMCPQHFNCVNDLISLHLFSFFCVENFRFVCFLFENGAREDRKYEEKRRLSSLGLWLGLGIERELDISARNKLFRFIYFHCNVNFFFHWNVKTSRNACILCLLDGFNSMVSSSIMFFNAKFKSIFIAIRFLSITKNEWK